MNSIQTFEDYMYMMYSCILKLQQITHILTCTYVLHIYICIYACMYVHICIYACVYMDVYVYRERDMYLYIEICLKVQCKLYFKCIRGIYFSQESCETYSKNEYSHQHITLQQIPKKRNVGSPLSSPPSISIFLPLFLVQSSPQRPSMVKSTQLINIYYYLGRKKCKWTTE